MEKTAPPPAAVQTWEQPPQTAHPAQPQPVAQPTPKHKKTVRERIDISDALLLVVAVFIPPFAVWLKRGCGGDLCINILLDFLGWIPGVIHAWYIICTKQ
ncbi:hypothetical protein BCR35DRAFT_307033 [Leucosporidium creatinivorum]|uniref:Plasma membrane proteolipid 3 n=1 Tax=Leucosporidium creatinivorum TaxID=106004 RepID=A0A1Y2EPS0_9BASI|nr:hypothetical protein BCR35DRAFT_307033 [Leucosporidium creatinivorum]